MNSRATVFFSSKISSRVPHNDWIRPLLSPHIKFKFQHSELVQKREKVAELQSRTKKERADHQGRVHAVRRELKKWRERNALFLANGPYVSSETSKTEEKSDDPSVERLRRHIATEIDEDGDIAASVRFFGRIAYLLEQRVEDISASTAAVEQRSAILRNAVFRYSQELGFVGEAMDVAA